MNMHTKASRRRSAPSISRLARDFAAPPCEHRPLAWWMLNGDLKPEIMRRQLERFRDYGFGGYATYPYRGLTIPYHSEQWWQAMQSMLESSRELGLDVWLLDEFNWSSGHCAGYVLRDQPWLRSAVLRHEESAVEPAAEVMLAVDGEVLAVVFESEGVVSAAADWRLEMLPQETRLRWTNRTGTPRRLHVITRCLRRGTSYFAHGAPWALGPSQAWGHLDLLNPDGIQAVLRYTHEQYAARFPHLLGTTIKGFFTDENTLSSGGLPYTRGVEDEFARRYGYGLRAHLPELFLATGDFLKVRYDYWRIMADWIGAHYYQPYRDWCDSHGVALTGHLCGEEGIRGHVVLNADIFEAGRRLTYPGVDMLYGATGYDPKGKWNRPGNHYAEVDPRAFHLTLKIAQSTAKHTRAARMFNEAFTCEDYAANPHDLKRACNYYAAIGVSLLLLADFNYSHAGIRKRRGGSKCFATPWNRYYPRLTDYIGRLSVFAAAGRPKAEIGILYPRTTGWVHPAGPEVEMINAMLYRLLDVLLRSHWQFDFVYEQLLEKGRAAQGRLRLPTEDYRVLIAPGCKALPERALRTLEEFVGGGGVLLVLPPFGEESPDCPQVVERAGRLLEAETCVVWEVPDESAAACRACDELLGRWLRKPLLVEGPGARDMVVSHRAAAGADLFLLANMGERQADLKLSAAGGERWESWDLESGERARLPMPAFLSFAPGEAVVLCAGRLARPGPTRAAPAQRPRRLEAVMTIPGPWRFSLAGKNQLRLDPMICYDLDDAGLAQHWERSGAQEDWRPLVQHASERDLDAASMPAYWLRATFNAEHTPPDLELVVDSDLVTDVFFNQQELSAAVPAMVWHDENRAYRIGALLRRGENEVVLRCRTERLNLERICNMPATPIVLVGSFSVSGDTLAPPRREMPIGPWCDNGYAHLAGTAIYETEFTWSAPAAGRVWLDLGRVRDVAEVTLNGTACGARLWQPYRFDVTRALRAGANQLTIAVTSGIGNLLPYGYTDQLVPGPVPYGLLDPPRLVQEMT